VYLLEHRRQRAATFDLSGNPGALKVFPRFGVRSARVMIMKQQKDVLLPLSAYRELLTAKRAELTSGSPPGGAALSDLGGMSCEDQAPVLHDQFIEFHLKRLDYQKLKLIDAALDRLTTGDFGLCVQCGEMMASKRLAAIPWADCCVTCQEQAGLLSAPADPGRRAA
jgi:DnaK suppressor protein